jgi:hypothetical protein
MIGALQMKQFLVISVMCGTLVTAIQARAADQRCKVDGSSGKVLAVNSSEFNDRFCGLVGVLLEKKKQSDAALSTELGQDFDPATGGPYSFIIISALLINRQNDSPDALNSLKSSFLSLIEESRVDKQVGAGSSSSGTTSLTSKGNVPEILGMAVENGALTESKSGTTVTFTGNPVGIIKALGNKGYLEGYADDGPFTRHIRDFSFSLSFDTSRGNSQGTFTGDAQQVSSYSFRYALVNHRDPRSRIYNRNWLDLAQGAARTTLINENNMFNNLRTNEDFKAWLQSTSSNISSAAKTGTDQEIAANIEKALSDQLFTELDKIQNRLINEVPTLLPLLKAYSQADALFLTDRQKILDLASKGSIVTLEYVNNRRLNAPDISNFKIIAEGSSGTQVDLTGNLSFDILSQTPSVEPGANRLQDIKASGEADFRLGNVVRLGSVVLAVSGMYERQLNDTITSAGTVAAKTKGDIAIGQLKVTIPVKGSGVKIPFSFSVANRSDLIKETDVRGNFGITFDLDSIFAKASP